MNPPVGRQVRRHLPLLFLLAAAATYEVILLLVSGPDPPYRFPTPFAIPIFDTPFALMAIGVGYLCLERHRLRQDLESAAIGVTLWLTALLAFAHILAQPDYPANPGVNPGIAPYFFFASFFIGLAGVGLAAQRGDQPFPLTDRTRFQIGAGGFALSVVLVTAVVLLRHHLPSPVMPPGRFTPLTLRVAGLMLGAFAVWVLWGGRRRLFGPDRDVFATYLLFAYVVWTMALLGLLTSKGFRYSIPWYLAGLARPLGVGVVFVGLLREQVWFYREARARLRDLEGLHRAGEALVRSLDPREIVQTIATKAVEVMRADGAILFRVDSDGQALRAVSRAGVISASYVTGLELLVGEGAAGIAVARRQPAWTRNVQSDFAMPFPDAVRAKLRQEGLRAIMAVPLLVQTDEIFGALSVFYRNEREFSDADVELLSAFGTQASVAIENARSFERLALRAHNDEVLQAVAQRYLEATVERDILEDAVRVTRELLEADCVGIFLFDLAANTLRLEAGSGWQPGTVGSLALPPAEESLAGYTFLHKQAAEVADLADEQRFHIPAHLASHGLQAGIALPLGVREQPVGILAAYYRVPHRFSDEESRTLTSLVHQTALALEKVRLHADLQTSLLRLKETQAQLIQADKLKALGTLLSGMAHELNSPLSTIQLSLQLMGNQVGLPEPIRRRLDVLDGACERAARIVRELLVFARRRPTERRRVDLNEVVRHALTLQAPEFALNNILVVNGLSPIPAIWADAAQLQQVLLNLLNNARDALKGAGHEGVLTVRSREVPEGVMVQVEDNGPGIAPENLHRVFDPFFTTKGVGEGTGLGLSLSIGIVEAHGGSLQAETVLGGGSRFTMRLPLGQGVETTEPVEPERAAPPRRAKILVVEDDAPLRTVLAEIFAGLNHAVDEAGTGRAARDRLEHNTYDVVTIDLKLPDIDGKVIWRWIRDRRPELATRVIFMTGDTMTAETQDFLRETGRPVLNKPFVIQDIARVVEAVLRASPVPPSS